MLVVSRSKDQSMVIGDDLMVTLAEVQADRVLIVVSRRAGDRITFWEESARQWVKDGATMPLTAEVFVTVWIIGDHVRLGFECPRKMTVHRKEIYDALHPI